MLIMSKKSGIIYENICLEKLNDFDNIVDTEDITEIDFNEYGFGYTRLCEDCAKIAGKEVGFEGTHCFSINCNHDNSSFIGEVTFTKEEIMNDLVVYKE